MTCPGIRIEASILAFDFKIEAALISVNYFYVPPTIRIPVC
jgi:hypothetical protein